MRLPKKGIHCNFSLCLQTRKSLNFLPRFQLIDRVSLLLYCELFTAVLLPFVAQALCFVMIQTGSAEILQATFFSFQFQGISCWIIFRLMMKFQAWRTIIVCDCLHRGEMSSSKIITHTFGGFRKHLNASIFTWFSHLLYNYICSFGSFL